MEVRSSQVFTFSRRAAGEASRSEGEQPAPAQRQLREGASGGDRNARREKGGEVSVRHDTGENLQPAFGRPLRVWRFLREMG
jgi:hypothetical protein